MCVEVRDDEQLLSLTKMQQAQGAALRERKRGGGGRERDMMMKLAMKDYLKRVILKQLSLERKMSTKQIVEKNNSLI
jgi:hypothetical protein